MKNINYICHAPYLRNNIAYDHDFWYTCVKWWYLQAFFWVFQNLDFLGCWGSKRAKNGPKWQKFCPSYFISQEPYIIWLSFMLHLCKMAISPGFFLFFQNLDFLGCLEDKRAKNDSKMTKNYVRRAWDLRNDTLYDCHLWYTCVKW